MLDVADTIAAIAVPHASGARGVVRVSGPEAISVVERCFTSADGQRLCQLRQATALTGTLRIALADRPSIPLPCDAFVWRGSASYTRQPTVELHTLGSPPLLQATLRHLCDQGARMAEPGEFTLRAFLAGRIDLTQAEAVLGVIDARGAAALQTALRQLAGGLTQPLAALRSSLIDLLADLEAGLDFVEEDIEFVTRDEVLRRVDHVATEVQSLIGRLSHRGEAASLPRLVLVGPPNSGKSSLFNALVQQFGTGTPQPALVSNRAGTTRDFLAVRLALGDIQCELVDTAGIEQASAASLLDAAAQELALDQGRRADLLLQCVDATSQYVDEPAGNSEGVIIFTKCDLQSPIGGAGIATSAHTGAGLAALASELRVRAIELAAEEKSGLVAGTSARCAESLQSARDGLARLRQLVIESAGDELVAAELRDILNHLGRVVGTVYTDDILGQIFGRFCIGK